MKPVYFADFDEVGDRSVLILDGRETLTRWQEHARNWAVKHGYKGYSIRRGTFTNSTVLHPWINI